MDQALPVEKCDKGPCLKKVRKPNLPKLYKKLLETKSRFGKLGVGGGQPGESKNNTGGSCSIIKSVTGTNVAGFFWVKDKCSDEAFKVYCRMDVNNPYGYAIMNDHEYLGINILNAHNLSSPEQLLHVCAKNGFSIAKIREFSDLYTIATLAMQ